MASNFNCPDCGGDCETLLLAMQRSIGSERTATAAVRLSHKEFVAEAKRVAAEPTAGEVFRFENPGVSDEFDPEGFDAD